MVRFEGTVSDRAYIVEGKVRGSTFMTLGTGLYLSSRANVSKGFRILNIFSENGTEISSKPYSYPEFFI